MDYSATHDAAALEQLRLECPWQHDPRYFQRVAISPSAIMKMTTHCQSGVDKGIQKGGNPIEVMGLLLGRPTPRTLVVTDVFPLPIEGFETRVIADDVDVINHMIALGESLERTRYEKFMGWYHSHPFDLGPHSHCFLSQTDIGTQLQWQRAEDPHGNPFLAIVLDPLRSLAQGIPELKAFRAYPPEYTSPILHQCPDGSIVPEEQTRLEKWGSCWAAYYELEVEYFVSNATRNVLSLLTKDFFWMRTLTTSAGIKCAERVEKVADRIRKLDIAASSSTSSGPGGMEGIHSDFEQFHSRPLGSRVSRGRMSTPSKSGGGSSTGTTLSGKVTEAEKEESGGEVGKACQAVVDIATEKLLENIGQITKKELFSHGTLHGSFVTK